MTYSLEEARRVLQQRRDQEDRVRLELASRGSVDLATIAVPRNFADGGAMAMRRIAEHLRDLPKSVTKGLSHFEAMRQAGRLLAYSFAIAAFSHPADGANFWRVAATEQLRHDLNGPTFHLMFIRAVELLSKMRWQRSGQAEFLRKGCAELARRLTEEADSRNESPREDVYLSPRQCIDRLPLQGVPEHQKYHHLGRLRRKCSQWMRTERRGPAYWINADDFYLARDMLRRRSMNKKNYAESVAALPEVPSEEDREAMKAKIREENLQKRRAMR